MQMPIVPSPRGVVKPKIFSTEEIEDEAKRIEGLRKHARAILEEAGSGGELQVTLDSMRMSLPNQDAAVSAFQEQAEEENKAAAERSAQEQAKEENKAAAA